MLHRRLDQITVANVYPRQGDDERYLTECCQDHDGDGLGNVTA